VKKTSEKSNGRSHIRLRPLFDFPNWRLILLLLPVFAAMQCRPII
jgi:hypothetical protein